MDGWKGGRKKRERMRRGEERREDKDREEKREQEEREGVKGEKKRRREGTPCDATCTVGMDALKARKEWASLGGIPGVSDEEGPGATRVLISPIELRVSPSWTRRDWRLVWAGVCSVWR